MRLPAKVRAWLVEPPPPEVLRFVERLARLDDVRAIALMPDVHLAEHVCVGTVVATGSTLLPRAVGGDIGCGMSAQLLCGALPDGISGGDARALLAGWSRAVPAQKHRARQRLPDELAALQLGTSALRRTLSRDGAVQLGTLGRGNHFLELHVDDDDAPWLVVHSGSRALGPAVRDAHLRGSEPPGLLADASPSGRGYLADASAAVAFAEHNRRVVLSRAAAVVFDVLRIQPAPDPAVECTHNFVRRELHAGEHWWVHRKGAVSARAGERGIIPGSMGADTFLVTGRGCAAALCSSSHGAGRTMSRSEARRRVTARTCTSR